TVRVPMMYQGVKAGYTETTDAQILDLPYTGRELSMLVLLPKKGKPLSTVEKSLTAAYVDARVKALKTRPVEVYFPRFRLSENVPLGRTLTEMGMGLAFGRKADFSGIDGTKNLQLGTVRHQAAIDVNE